MVPMREIARLVGGTLVGDGALAPTGYAADSRGAGPGDLFFALPGAQTDGQRFLADAFARGAVAAVVSDRTLRPPAGRCLVCVDDVQEALQALAVAWRARFRVPFVAITGSNGKTTTKSLVAHFAGARFAAHVAQENFNTEIGLPLALLAMPEGAELGVFELGADRPGDIRILTRILRPSVGIVTSVGPSHLETFGTVRAVAEEKWNLVRDLPADAPAFVNADSPELARLAAAAGRPRLVTAGLETGDVRGRVVSAVPRLALELDDPPLRLVTELVGRQNATNLLLAALCALELGVAPRAIEERAASFRPVARRMEPRAARFGVVLDDVYNANLASMSAALHALAEFETSSLRVAVLGDMLGLGDAAPALHEELARLALSLPIDLVYPVGERAEAAFGAAGDRRVLGMARGEIAADVVARLSGASDAVVLVKGSRGVRLETVADEILRRSPADGA